MQFIDLATQQKRIRGKIEDNIKKVLDHGRYVMGPEIEELEKKLADYCRVKYAVGVGSGTEALLMILMALGIREGDAVFTTDFTFIATAEVIQILNARPVFVDIDPDTYNMCPTSLKQAIDDIKKEGKYKPRAIIPVDLFGQCADYEQINEIAQKNNLTVIQDAAQSFGAISDGKRAGSHGEIAATSFFPAKPLGAYGDAGMIFTSNQELVERLLSIRIHGMGNDKYENVRVGINGRLDSMQAAVLLAKFEIFEEELDLRQQVAKNYTLLLRDLIKIPFTDPSNRSSWAQYSVEYQNRDKIINALHAEKIPTAIHYKIPLHLQRVFLNLGYKKGDFPVSEEVSNKIFSLPMHPYLDFTDQKKIAEIIKACC